MAASWQRLSGSSAYAHGRGGTTHVNSKSASVSGAHADAEDARLGACLAEGPDTGEGSEAALAELHPSGGPKAKATKQPVSIRRSAEVVAYFKAGGKGWQTRIDEVLRRYVRERS